MFTIFRCMIGDCTTAGGRSLTLMWSKGYGVQFDIFYSFSGPERHGKSSRNPPKPHEIVRKCVKSA